jgi:hypothetical protein
MLNMHSLVYALIVAVASNLSILTNCALAQSPELEPIAIIEAVIDSATTLNNTKSINIESSKLIKLRIEEALRNSRRFKVYERDTSTLQKSVLLEQDFALSQRALKDAAEFGKMSNVHFIVVPIVTSVKLESSLERDQQNSRFNSTINGEIILTLKIIDTTSGAIKYQKTENYSLINKTQISIMREPDYNDVWLNLLQKTGTEAGMAVFDAIFPIEIIQINGDEAILNRGEAGGLNLNSTLVLLSLGEPITDPKTGINLGKIERKIGECKIVSVSERISIAYLLLNSNKIAKTGDLCRRGK